MGFTENQKKLLNHASENLRKEEKDLHNADEKRKRARKEIELALKEDSNLSKFKKHELAGLDGLTEVQKSNQD